MTLEIVIFGILFQTTKFKSHHFQILGPTSYNASCPHQPHDRNQCSILFFDPPTSFYFYKPSYDKKIHKHDIKITIEGQQSYLTICTVFKGKFYGLTFPGSILVHLDLDHDLGIVTVAPLVNQRAYGGGELLEMPRWGEYLIQSSCDGNDMLLCVTKLYYGWLLSQVYGFLVYRFDFEEKAWVKMENIGETAIFLCGSTGTHCSTRGNNLIKKGSIYFTEGRCVYLFDLETRKISIISLPCPHVFIFDC
ncbi:hypothetical protein H5410_017305 [Solanum commersonii]|uniref:KIB1-4 beta-propeller domain-containing protein n=1 Tax=Solanum commersonii TaxID=4109 RepID=A0A9J5ZYX2_SOLCO|nr:hypothetical protein H5410_017305 [Solanum commersonii]